jgi:hypothetical protein
MSLLPLMRIVIESAMIYVLAAILLLALYTQNNNFQYVVQESLVPIIGMSSEVSGFVHYKGCVLGIVYTLITVRLAIRSSKTLATAVGGDVLPIEWQAGNPRTVNSQHGEIGTTTDTMDISLKPVGLNSPTESMDGDNSWSGTQRK